MSYRLGTWDPSHDLGGLQKRLSNIFGGDSEKRLSLKDDTDWAPAVDVAEDDAAFFLFFLFFLFNLGSQLVAIGHNAEELFVHPRQSSHHQTVVPQIIGRSRLITHDDTILPHQNHSRRAVIWL